MKQRKEIKLPSNWLEEIYEKRKQELFRFLYVLLGDKQSAEDALQDTFLKAYLHRSKYIEMQQEKAWLYQIARNTAYDMLRKRHREFPVEKEQINDAIEKVTHHEDVHEHLIYMEMIADLNEVEREIVSLKIIAGLTHQEIAKVLHMTTGSVKKRYERALNKLKANYEEDEA